MTTFMIGNTEIEKAIKQYMKRSPAHNHVGTRAIEKATIEIIADFATHGANRSKAFYVVITIDDSNSGDGKDSEENT